MKIKCVNIFNENTGQYQTTSPWLTIGKEYVVLGIEVYNNKTYYLFIDDSSNEVPGLHKSDQFEVTSKKLSKSWIIRPSLLGIFFLIPAAWDYDDFWDKCYDGDPEALETYKREVRKIYEEENES